MNLAHLTVGTKVLLARGDQTEVVAMNTEAESVCVRYLDALGEPELVGTEAWLSADRGHRHRHGHACRRADVRTLSQSGRWRATACLAAFTYPCSPGVGHRLAR